MIKIGYTSGAVFDRLRSFATDNPNRLFLLKVIDGGPQDEKSLHSRFDRYRVTREWFKAVPDILLYIWNARAAKFL